MSRRVTRRALLAGGAAVATVGVGGFGLSRLTDPTEAVAPTGNFFVGLNTSGLEVPVPKAPSPEMLDTYASYGVTRLRLPGLWEYFQPKPNGPLDADYLKLYLDVVDDAARRGMTVLVEPCHNYGGRKIGNAEHKLGDGTLDIAMLADFWRRFVEATSDVTAIDGWDIMNEPRDLPGTSGQDIWFEAAQATVDTIRDLGEERPITIEVYAPGSHLAWSEMNVDLYTVTDPLKKLTFSHHVYLDHNNSGANPYWEDEVAIGDTHGGGGPLTYDVGVKRIEPFVDFLRKHDLQGNIGEIGAGWSDTASGTSSTGWQLALDSALKYCHDEGLPVYAWGAGAYFGRPYELSLEPTNGVPAPQWEILQRYLTPATELPPLGIPSATASPIG